MGPVRPVGAPRTPRAAVAVLNSSRMAFEAFLCSNLDDPGDADHKEGGQEELLGDDHVVAVVVVVVAVAVVVVVGPETDCSSEIKFGLLSLPFSSR